MPRNVEIKARVTDPVSLTEKAKALAGEDGLFVEQIDTFFNAINGRLKLRSIKVSISTCWKTCVYYNKFAFKAF